MTHKRMTVNKSAETGRFAARSSEKGAKLHVVQKPTGEWAVKQSGYRKATGVFRSQREAIAAARKLAQAKSANVVVHRRDGTIRQVYRQGSRRSSVVKRPTNGFGCARGLIKLAPDFDEPLADLEDYT